MKEMTCDDTAERFLRCSRNLLLTRPFPCFLVSFFFFPLNFFPFFGFATCSHFANSDRRPIPHVFMEHGGGKGSESFTGRYLSVRKSWILPTHSLLQCT